MTEDSIGMSFHISPGKMSGDTHEFTEHKILELGLPSTTTLSSTLESHHNIHQHGQSILNTEPGASTTSFLAELNEVSGANNAGISGSNHYQLISKHEVTENNQQNMFSTAENHRNNAYLPSVETVLNNNVSENKPMPSLDSVHLPVNYCSNDQYNYKNYSYAENINETNHKSYLNMDTLKNTEQDSSQLCKVSPISRPNRPMTLREPVLAKPVCTTPNRPRRSETVKVRMCQISVEELKNKIVELQSDFPDIERKYICDTLTKCNFSIPESAVCLRKEVERRATASLPRINHCIPRDAIPPPAKKQKTSPVKPKVKIGPVVIRGNLLQDGSPSYKKVESTLPADPALLYERLQCKVKSQFMVPVSMQEVESPSPVVYADPFNQVPQDPMNVDIDIDQDTQPLICYVSSIVPSNNEVTGSVEQDLLDYKDPEMASQEEDLNLQDPSDGNNVEETDSGHAEKTTEPVVTHAIQSGKFFKVKAQGSDQIKKEYVKSELEVGGWMDKATTNKGQSPAQNFQRNLKAFMAQQKKQVATSKPEKDGMSDEEIPDADEDLSYQKVKDVESDDSDYEEHLMNKSEDEKSSIISFFNDSSIDELLCISGISRKKANILIQHRPFVDYVDLMEKLEKSKQLGVGLVDACKDTMRMRQIVLRLMSKCERISAQLEARVARLLSAVTLEESGAALTLQPACLNPNLCLKPYQLVGLNWLRMLHDHKLSCIVGDQMGLGKTIQVIAFLAQLLEEGDPGPHLIVVPSSTLDNWQRELLKWCPQLETVLYYGNQDDRKAIRQAIYNGSLKDFKIILTTYTIATGALEDRAMLKNLEFLYGVFDEAHMLKNMLSRRYKSLINLRVRRRILMTGTPIQNNLVELMSLLSFVMPDIFSSFKGSSEILKKMFQLFQKTSAAVGNDEAQTSGSNVSRSQFEMERIQHCKKLIRPFLLRRTKNQVLQQLPPKTERTHFADFTEQQAQLYDSLVKRFRTRVTSGADTPLALNFIMELRKAANHPLLLRNLYTDDRLREISKKLRDLDPGHTEANPELIMEDLSVMSDFEIHKTCQLYPCLEADALDEELHLPASGKLQVLEDLLHRLIPDGHRILIFSQFVKVLDILQAFLELRYVRFLRLDGSTPVADRQMLIDQFTAEPDIPVFMLTTRAGGLGINLAAADTVIIHDPDFNPYNDKQAEDRCHRLGQERPVHIIRLLASKSVETGINRIAEDKLNLEKEVTEMGPDVIQDSDSESGSRSGELPEPLSNPTCVRSHELLNLLSDALGLSTPQSENHASSSHPV